MKRRPWNYILIAAIMLMICGCSGEEAGSEDKYSGKNIYAESSAAAETAETQAEAPFESYTFELKGIDANYMITISPGDSPQEIAVTLENNRYESSSFIITAPADYLPMLPAYQTDAADSVNIITNDIDERKIPDIIQLNFWYSPENGKESSGNDDTHLFLSRFYTAADNTFREINVVERTEDGDNIISSFDSIQLYHTEADKFISRITVDENADPDDDEDEDHDSIARKVKINTLTLDTSTPALVSGYEEISEDNPLYFGYAYWAAANSAAQYFNTYTFNITDYDNYVEKTDDNGEKEYYFPIDDSRYASVGDLLDYLRETFSDSLAESILDNAPQKYCDIDGKLYGMISDGAVDTTLGTLTFSGMDIYEDKMVFRSRQEKFDELSNTMGYTDGGQFEISRIDGEWKVTAYRFPYSL
ncbi:MAG: hypothetical protein ACI4KF_11005 [Huintestinicola sp.]